jgi:uncharacterized membrane protein SpoIIM required for sporulation
MNLAEFLTARRPAWGELDRLLGLAEAREAAALGHARARRLVDLYRRASADLVQARTYGAGLEVTGYLESLVARGYALLYQAPPLRVGRSLLELLAWRFPARLRREALAFGLAVAAFAAGLLLGGLATARDPEASRLFVPAEHQRLRPRERVRLDEERQRTGRELPGALDHAAFSSFLFTHNIQVSIVCFAIGVAWGLPTLLLLGWHGVFLAALAVEYFRDGVGTFFLAWILPHGVIELTSMLLASSAGLMLGRGVLWPRGRPRGERVREEARAGLELLAGAAALLVVAGVIEGTLSQVHEPTLPYALKIGFALGGLLLLHGWLWLWPLRTPPSGHSARRDFSSR